jgi:hypothetical protein
MQHMQTKLCKNHFKKSNAEKCNAKDPNIELQAFHAVELPDKADRSNKLQVILQINAVDSENRPAYPPIIASVELTKLSWNVLQQNHDGRFSIQ